MPTHKRLNYGVLDWDSVVKEIEMIGGEGEGRGSRVEVEMFCLIKLVQKVSSRMVSSGWC